MLFNFFNEEESTPIEIRAKFSGMIASPEQILDILDLILPIPSSEQAEDQSIDFLNQSDVYIIPEDNHVYHC